MYCLNCRRNRATFTVVARTKLSATENGYQKNWRTCIMKNVWTWLMIRRRVFWVMMLVGQRLETWLRFCVGVLNNVWKPKYWRYFAWVAFLWLTLRLHCPLWILVRRLQVLRVPLYRKILILHKVTCFSCKPENKIYTNSESKIASCVQRLDFFAGTALRICYDAWAYVDFHVKEKILELCSVGIAGFVLRHDPMLLF